MWNVFYRQPRLVAVTLMLILSAGLTAYQILPRLEDPRFTRRFGYVVTRWPGASAERIEALVSDKLEEQLQTVDEIQKLVSFSRTGVSVINIDLHDDVGPDEVVDVWARIRDKLGDAAPLLPRGAAEPDLDSDESYADTFIVALVWASKQSDNKANNAILTRLAEELRDELLRLPGTEHIKTYGLPEEEIRVEVSQTRIAALGLTVQDLADQVIRSDAKVSAGRLRSGDSSLLVELESELDYLKEIGQVPIRRGADGTLIRLGDFGQVIKTAKDPPSQLAMFDGEPGVAIAVRMAPNYRMDRWASTARRSVERFRARLGMGIDARIIFDQSRYAEDRLGTLIRSFVLGNVAVMMVVFVMMGWRSALLVGSALPLSVLMVLSGMQWLGIPIHQMSVTGLIIALGMLIDNAIIMVDDVSRRLQRGEPPADATAASVRHLLLPLAGSTLTTALAFMPIALMPGRAGEFVGSIAISVVLAVGSSLFLAMTIVPAISGWFLHDRPFDQGSWWSRGVQSDRIAHWYGLILDRLFTRPALTIALALVIPLVGFVVGSRLPEQFFPPAERDQFQVQLWMPRNVSVQTTQRYATKVSEILSTHDQIVAVHWFIGGGSPMYYYNLIPEEGDAPFFAQALVQTTTHHDATKLIRQLQERLDIELPTALILVRQLEQGPPFEAPIEIKIYGDDLDRLQQLGNQLRQVLSSLPGVIHTRASLAHDQPKLWLRLDEDEARLAGLENLEIARQLNANLEGSVGGSLLENTEELPVRIRLLGTQRSHIEHIASMDIRRPATSSADMSGVPLSSIAQLELVPQAVSIERRQGQRSNSVFGYIEAGLLPAGIIDDFKRKLKHAGFSVPSGYRLEWAGESGERDAAIEQLMKSVPILAVLMAMSLLFSLGSFRLAGLIALVGATSIGLALLCLWIFGYAFGFMAILGCMGLVGVAINDSIVVLAALKADPAACRGDPGAVRNVVMRSTRHVLCTTVTTVAGFAPLFLAGGQLWPPLAVTIAFGVLGATPLALTLVPSAFLLLRRRRDEVVLSRLETSAA